MSRHSLISFYCDFVFRKMSNFPRWSVISWSHNVLVGHRAGGAEGDHRVSKDKERRSTGCHTRSFEHPRKHERLDNQKFFPCLSFGSFDMGCFRLPDLRIQRQNSCESISSLNSLTSMSSMGSMKDQDAKKKKKKSWVRTKSHITTVLYSNIWYVQYVRFLFHVFED